VWEKIISIVTGLVDFGALAKRALDQIDAFKRWMFVTERTGAYDSAEAKLKATGDTDELEQLLQDPNRD
jgi:hypothetical protein